MTADSTVAEAVAAGICWLARWNAGRVRPVVLAESAHPDHCRYCEQPLDEVLQAADLGRLTDSALKSWKRAPRNERVAAIRQAQEEPWWQAIP